MKEIIINSDNILDSEITTKKIVDNFIFLNDDRILLSHHHNAYFFIHDCDCDEKELFLIKKEYVLDYPFPEDKCLITNNYYLVKRNIDIEGAVWIKLSEVVDLITNEKLLNPRTQDVSNDIIEIAKILLNIAL